MTIAESVAFVRKIMGDNSSIKYNEDDDIVLFLNNSAINVSSKTVSNLTFMDGLTADGDERYPLHLKFLSLKAVYIIEGSNAWQLERLNVDEWANTYGMSTAKGRPCHFRIEEGAVDVVPGAAPGDIWLRPIPDATVRTLRVAFYKRTSKLSLTNPDDSYELKEPFHRAICYHAAMELSLSLADKDRIGYFKGLYDQAMADAAELIGRADRSEPHQFEKVYGNGRANWRRRR